MPTPPKNTADQALLQSVTAFLYQEAKYLDALDYDSWLGLFTEDARYWIPLKRDAKDHAAELNHAYDNLLMLRLRAERKSTPDGWGQQPPPATSRVIGNIEVAQQTDGTVQAECTFICWQWYRGKTGSMGGRLFYTLEPAGDSWKIRFKKVQLPAPEVITGADGVMY
ncbi:MAG: aromatic-ring-hydroxylating dioxygenase subunit beta [Cellvibrionales bacterium]|nr:aromatic-ring-hydroxylating dioxygenase subunit beta [Cellvibrionales bacterium]